jgi:hypothetical protein
MANPKSNEARQAYIDRNPFQGFNISDNSVLGKLEGRHPCPKCGKSRKYFCYTCYVPIAELEALLPVVKLPIKIDIIKHKHEIDGKSTAGHAAVLAPCDVSIYTYPDIPDYSGENVVLIFPSQNAMSISQLVRKENHDHFTKSNNVPLEELPRGFNRSTLMTTALKSCDSISVNSLTDLPVTRAIFIDSTWNQSKGIYKDEKIRKIPCVVIQNRVSQFWRHQKGSPRWYLATIEAIHQFFIELHLHCWGLDPKYKGIHNCFTEMALSECESLYRKDAKSYNGQYDDLLYFFKHMYDLIHAYYDHDNLYAYKRRLM